MADETAGPEPTPDDEGLLDQDDDEGLLDQGDAEELLDREHPHDPEEPYPEPDPEADLRDPERDLPNVPTVSIPAVSRSEADVPGELLRDFWTTVVVLNVAFLALSIGAMMVAFGVERQLGLALVAVGLLSLYRGYRKYRTLDEKQASGEH